MLKVKYSLIICKFHVNKVSEKFRACLKLESAKEVSNWIFINFGENFSSWQVFAQGYI